MPALSWGAEGPLSPFSRPFRALFAPLCSSAAAQVRPQLKGASMRAQGDSGGGAGAQLAATAQTEAAGQQT